MPLVAIAMMAAIFFGLLALCVPPLGFTLLGILLFGALAAAFLTRKKRLCVPLAWILAAVLSAIAFTGFYVQAGKRNAIDFTLEHDAAGVVYASAVRDGETILVLEDVYVDGISVSGRLELRIAAGDDAGLAFAKAGDTVSLQATLYEVLWADGLRVNANAFRDRIRLRAYPKGENCSLVFGTMNPLQKLRTQLYATLQAQLGKNYGDLAYGILTGDKRGLSLEIRDYIGVSGLGHILAVSGLHIGFISAVLLWLMKRCRAWVRCSVTSAILIAYMVFVGFTPSVVRAVVMCIVGLLTLINGQRRDSMSSLGLAMSVILAVSPISMFDIGFIMSCSAVFAMICLLRPFTRVLRKIHIPARLAQAVAVSATAQLGILPSTIYYFHTVQVYSVLTNVLLMPLISVTFILLLLFAVVALLIPPIAAILKGAGLCLALVDLVAYGVSLLPFAAIVLYGGASVFLAEVLFFIASPFFMLPRGKRWVNIGALLAACICMFVPVHYFRDYDTIMPVDAYRDVTSVVSVGRDIYVIGDCNSADDITVVMRKFYIRKITAVFLTGLTEKNAEQVVVLGKAYRIGAVYFPATDDMQGVRTVLSARADVWMFEQDDSIPIGTLYRDKTFQGYTIREREKDMIFLGYKTRYTDLGEAAYERAGVVRCYMYLNALPSYIYITNLPEGYLGEAPFFQVAAQGNYGVAFDYRNGEAYNRI